MIHAVARNAMLIAGVVGAGFVCAMAAPYLISPRGAAGPGVFWAQSPWVAIVAVVICFAIALAIACVVGRFINSAVGLFVLGAGLFVLDGRLDTIHAAAISSSGLSPRLALTVMALETVSWAVLCMGAVWVMFTVAGPLKDIEPDKFDIHPHPIASASAWRSAAAGVIVLAAVMIIGKSPMHGQMIGATFIGSMIAGLVGRLMSPHVQPMLLFVSPIMAGAIGYIVAMLFQSQPMDVAFRLGQLPALSMALPIDYAAGSLMGVAMGLGWAKSFLQHEDLQSKAVTSPSSAASGT